MFDLVSVYIPTKNRLPLLRRAVDSVLTQTMRNIELIIVSDGSSDETCNYVRSIKSDIPIQLIHNESSCGACFARNQAIKIAKGRFVTGLDDDDYFMPQRIESFLTEWNKLEAEGMSFSCLYDVRIVDDGKKVWMWNLEKIVDHKSILVSNRVGNQIFTTRERMIEVGLYNLKMPAWQDWDLAVRLIKKFGPALNIRAYSYFMDMSHGLGRISLSSQQNIKVAARLFYINYCSSQNLPAVLLSMGYYAQVKLTLRDLLVLFYKKKFGFVARKLIKGEFQISLKSSVA